MGLDTKILSLDMIKGDIWAKYDFAGGHFENDVIPEVQPNFVMAASIYHQWEGLRSKLKQVGGAPGSFWPMDCSELGQKHKICII